MNNNSEQTYSQIDFFPCTTYFLVFNYVLFAIVAMVTIYAVIKLINKISKWTFMILFTHVLIIASKFCIYFVNFNLSNINSFCMQKYKYSDVYVLFIHLM